jgi:serine/threonine-protein kinase RsbW
MSERFKFVIPGRPEHISTVRLAVGSVAASCGFNVEEIEDIKTAAGEACQLVSCHEMEGYAKEYTVECETEPGKITIKVINTSDELMEKTGKRCIDCPNEGEIGKLLIKSLMDSVEVSCEDDKKTIVMTKTKK